MTQRLVGGWHVGRAMPSDARQDDVDAAWLSRERVAAVVNAQAPEPAVVADEVLGESLGDDWLALLPAGPAVDRLAAVVAAHRAADSVREHEAAARSEINRQIGALEQAIRRGVAAGTEVRRAARDLLELRAIRDVLDTNGPEQRVSDDDTLQISAALSARAGAALPSPGRPPLVAAEVIHFGGPLHRFEVTPQVSDDDAQLVMRLETLSSTVVSLRERREALRQPLYSTGLLALERRARAVQAWVDAAATYRSDVDTLRADVDEHDRARALAGRTHWCRREYGWLRIGEIDPAREWTLHAAIAGQIGPEPYVVAGSPDRDPAAT